uniref:Uncharacterized protein n=1 Tax=Setaria italica TaxID=4555 RepID=K3Z0E2_SETIT
GTSNLLQMIFDLLTAIENVECDIDDGRITEATITLITGMLSHMSERARSHIISNLALPTSHQRDPQLAHPPQPNNYWRMWRSFMTTIGFSIASNVVLYFLSVGMRLLEQTDEGSNIHCGEPPSAEPQQDVWSKWVIKFTGWLVERVAAPFILIWFVVLIRERVINNENHMLEYEQNGTANVLVNGLSRAFFLAIRGFPGIRDPELWARLASVLVDVLGAAFLWWMGGHWDPDIADG